MRPNPIKPRLAAGGCAFGTMTFEFFTPGYPAICREAGAEFILYDMEHSGVGFETMKAQFAFCRGLDLVPLVRVPSGDYHHIARALDIGAMGIMVPMVETPEQAQAIVDCTRYPPAGRRGAAFSVAGHDDYADGAVTDKIAEANARTMVIALVETAKGIENVDAIAAVDGVDVVWLGHFDLTNFLGIPAQFDNPIFHAAVDQSGRSLQQARQDAGLSRRRREMGARLPRQGLSHDRLWRRHAADAKRARGGHQSAAGDGGEIGRGRPRLWRHAMGRAV